MRKKLFIRSSKNVLRSSSIVAFVLVEVFSSNVSTAS